MKAGDVTSRLAQVALAAVLREVEADPGLAPDILARLLGVGSAPAPRSPDEDAFADIGRQVLAAGASGGNEEEPEERPAKRRKAKARKGYTIQNGNSEKKPSEAQALVERLIEAHNGVNPAARAIETSPAIFRGWRAGKPLKDPSLERLRGAVAKLDAGGNDEAQDDEEQAEQTEGAALLVQLEEKHGTRELVAERLGLTPESLERIAAGGVVGQTTLGRLRDGLRHPTPEEAQGAGPFRRAAAQG